MPACGRRHERELRSEMQTPHDHEVLVFPISTLARTAQGAVRPDCDVTFPVFPCLRVKKVTSGSGTASDAWRELSCTEHLCSETPFLPFLLFEMKVDGVRWRTDTCVTCLMDARRW